MANDREGLISSSLQLGNSASRAESYGRPGGLRSPVQTKAATAQAAVVAATAQGMPTLIMAVAIYEFCRAIIVGTVFALAVSNPAELASRTLWQIYFVVSNGQMRVNVFSLISCCYGLAIGLALFLRARWGRRILIGTSIYSVLRLVRFLLVYSSVSVRMSSDSAALAGMEFVHNCIYILVVVNVAIGLCMLYGPGSEEWFHKKA